MYVMKGGNLYGFCPAKARWDNEVNEYFKILLICAEMKILPKNGAISEQSSEIIDDLFWFLPLYDLMKFCQKADMILGDDSKSTGKFVNGRNRRINSPNIR